MRILSSRLERALRCKHCQALCEQEVAAVAIRDLLDVAGAAKFVHVFDEKNFHGGFKPFRGEIPQVKGTTACGQMSTRLYQRRPLLANPPNYG